MAITPWKLLFWQQTVCALQELPPPPRIEIGSQVMPMGTAMPLITTPKRPSSVLASELFDGCTELQHWTAPVLHELDGEAVGAGAAVLLVVGEAHGVATARSGKAARTEIARVIGIRANILEIDESESVLS